MQAPLACLVERITRLGMTNGAGTGGQLGVAEFPSRDKKWNRDNRESLFPSCKRSLAFCCHFLFQINMLLF